MILRGDSSAYLWYTASVQIFCYLSYSSGSLFENEYGLFGERIYINDYDWNNYNDVVDSEYIVSEKYKGKYHIVYIKQTDYFIDDPDIVYIKGKVINFDKPNKNTYEKIDNIILSTFKHND